MKPVYRISEYGSFITGKVLDGYVTLPPHTFEQLENFILTNRSKDTDALELMSLSARKGIGKVITAKNYVGIITMNDGTSIEILPKIYSAVEDDESGTRAKHLLIDMMKTLRDSPYKNLQMTSLSIERMNVFEIFIRMFLDEVFLIVKRGLKRSYEAVEENTNFFKGKLKFSQHIKHNHAHRERNFVEYDVFSVNRPENRLLKSTLLYLYKHSASSRNRTDIKSLLNSFAEVEASVDYKSDFTKCAPDRNMKDYCTALMWSRVFLMGKSFTSFAGSEVALALLFPMESLFESYVAALLKKHLTPLGYSVSAQDKTYHLFDDPKRFAMRPDIVIRRKADDVVFVMDTKWKLLADNKANYGIAQADMYQMSAYQKKYTAKAVFLIYPESRNLTISSMPIYTSEDGLCVNIICLDLFEITKSLDALIRYL